MVKRDTKTNEPCVVYWVLSKTPWWSWSTLCDHQNLSIQHENSYIMGFYFVEMTSLNYSVKNIQSLSPCRINLPRPSPTVLRRQHTSPDVSRLPN